jgi:hypothetical protein
MMKPYLDRQEAACADAASILLVAQSKLVADLSSEGVRLFDLHHRQRSGIPSSRHD